MIERALYIQAIENALKRTPVVSLLGPRQCGKTTLARIFEKKFHATFFDLESSQDLQRLQNPELLLGSLEGLVIIDEIQEKPELFKTLKVLVDKPDRRTRFLILGSASPHIYLKVFITSLNTFIIGCGVIWRMTSPVGPWPFFLYETPYRKKATVFRLFMGSTPKHFDWCYNLFISNR